MDRPSKQIGVLEWKAKPNWKGMTHVVRLNWMINWPDHMYRTPGLTVASSETRGRSWCLLVRASMFIRKLFCVYLSPSADLPKTYNHVMWNNLFLQIWMSHMGMTSQILITLMKSITSKLLNWNSLHLFPRSWFPPEHVLMSINNSPRSVVLCFYNLYLGFPSLQKPCCQG